MESSKRTFTKIAFISIWSVFTLSLAGWWYIYSMSKLERLGEIDLEFAEQLASSQRMLAWEGAFLLLCILGGGLTLAYFVIQDSRRQHRVMDFFLTLSHELKTPLAGIQLQAESLRDDLVGTPHEKVLTRLLKETGRLNTQLENALSLANLRSSQFFIESVHLADFLRGLFIEQAEVKIDIAEEQAALADSKALAVIMANLVRNALLHGEATEITISAVSDSKAKKVQITVEDNGYGFKGDLKKLGKQAFERHYRGSGNGLGLYLCRRLAEKMSGNLSFESASTGFKATLTVPEAKT